MLYYSSRALYLRTGRQACLQWKPLFSLKENRILILDFGAQVRFWNKYSPSVEHSQINFSQNWSHHSHKVLPFRLWILHTLALRISIKCVELYAALPKTPPVFPVHRRSSRKGICLFKTFLVIFRVPGYTLSAQACIWNWPTSPDSLCLRPVNFMTVR